MSNRKFFPLPTMLCVSLYLAACAGGGGGAAGTLANPAISGVTSGTGGTTSTVVSGGGSNPAPLCCVNGSVDAPAPVSFGDNPVAPQLASPGGPTFANPQTATFPLLFTGYQVSASGLAPITPGAGATLILTRGAPAATGDKMVTWQINVPSANLVSSGFERAGLFENFDSPVQALDYVAFGSWQWGLSESGNVGHFVFGYETPPLSMPVSGTATFSGAWEGELFTPKAGQPIQVGNVGGNASFSVDFLSGKISGALTAATSGGSYGIALQPWNDVSVSAAIAAGSNRFSGTTAAPSSPSASGTIAGAFYGPAAQQLGAVWTLSDGTSSAIGTVIAKH